MKGLLVSSVREDNPTILVKHKKMFGMKATCPRSSTRCRSGKAAVTRAGTDVTVVAYSYMAAEALAAARCSLRRASSAR